MFFGLFSNSMKEKSDKLDRELSDYFKKTRRIKARFRKNGNIIIVDNDEKIFNLLKFVIAKCDLCIGIYYHKTIDNAYCMLRDMEDEEVKAVIIGSNLVNGCKKDSLLCWIHENRPDIPVWVSGCSKEREKEIMGNCENVGVCGLKAGVFGENTDLKEYLDALGFPDHVKTII